MIDFGLPVHSGGVRPEMFKIVHLASFGRKDMQHHVAKILKNPTARIEPFDAERFVPFGGEHAINLVRDGAHLASARCRCQDEKIKDGRNPGQVQDGRVSTAVIIGCFGAQACRANAAVAPRGGVDIRLGADI